MKEKIDQPFSFSFKLKFKKKKSAEKDIIELINIENGSNKFYNIVLLTKGNSPESNYTVKISYGKVGGMGSSKNHGFALKKNAYDFMDQKMKEKLKRGYKRKEDIVNS